MGARIVLLRGINLGSRRRVAMPALRELLSTAGFDDVRTYVQSGNVVLSSDLSPQQLGQECERLITGRFGFDVDVVVRTGEELAEVVRRNPLATVAVNPRRYHVNFLSAEPDPDEVERVARLRVDPEQLVVVGREVYAWHPDGVARSKLWAALAAGRLGVITTARNWSTVTNLLVMAEELGS